MYAFYTSEEQSFLFRLWQKNVFLHVCSADWPEGLTRPFPQTPFDRVFFMADVFKAWVCTFYLCDSHPLPTNFHHQRAV